MEKITKNSTNEFRIATVEFKGKVYVDVREWYMPEGGDEWRPSKKGIRVSLEVFEQLKEAFNNLDTSKIDQGEDIQ